MRVPLRTTLDENLLKALKFKALELNVDMNDILEALINKYLSGEMQIEVTKQKK